MSDLIGEVEKRVETLRQAKAMAEYNMRGESGAEISKHQIQTETLAYEIDLYTRALTHIEQLESRDRWIPVSERLPNAEQKMLAYCSRHGICLERYFPQTRKEILLSYAGKHGHYFDETDFATHWMPLPEPPKWQK